MQRNAKVSDRVYIYIYVINIFERVQMDEFMWQLRGDETSINQTKSLPLVSIVIGEKNNTHVTINLFKNI